MRDEIVLQHDEKRMFSGIELFRAYGCNRMFCDFKIHIILYKKLDFANVLFHKSCFATRYSIINRNISCKTFTMEIAD